MPEFRAGDYGPAIASLLGLAGDGRRRITLRTGPCVSEEARARLKQWKASELFTGRKILSEEMAEAARSGLYLYFACPDEAHEIAQDIASSTGSYWHGILHRQEPDFGNAAYWFRRVGQHEIFPALHDEAAARLPERFGGSKWDPFRFIDACEEVHRHPDGALSEALEEIQRAEWQLLFDYCCRRAADLTST